MKDKAFQYQLAFWGRMTLICFLVMILNMIIAGTIMYFMSRYQSTNQVMISSIDSIACISMFVFGLVFFKPCFKYLLANGVTRRHFFRAIIQVLAIVAASTSVFVKVLQFIFSRFAEYPLIFELVYKSNVVSKVFGGALWLFAAIFLLAMSGWFINMLYYRSGNLLKVVISLLPVLLLTLLSGVNSLSGGGIYQGIGRFFRMFFGFSGGAPNPYTAVLSMLLLTIILGALNFLLIRKAQLKD
ncbi:MAG TPA: hypothetical protein VHY08_25080 [Bacillota bacterium]|nr:hypothetical protein [Bacillota bacterium]